jgi:hypothetical protein
MFAIFKDLYAVDKHILHTCRILMRLQKCGMIRNGIGIEHDDIGIIAGLKPSPLFYFNIVRGERG